MPINSERDFVDFINHLNAEWVTASRRLSPRVLTDLFEKAGLELAAWFESLPADTPALFGVSWAGEQQSEGWFDIGREFTELWHHQEQVRMAVGAPSLEDPRFLTAMIEISLRGLPHAYRATEAADGTAIAIEISGPAGGAFTLTRRGDGWMLGGGAVADAATTVRMSDATAWRLLYNALPADEVAAIPVAGTRRAVEAAVAGSHDRHSRASGSAGKRLRTREVVSLLLRVLRFTRRTHSNAERQRDFRTLNDLIQTCKDGELGFQSAAEGLKNPEIKAKFQEYSRQRAEMARELQAEVRRLGGDPEKYGSVSGSLHRGWLDVKQSITGKDDAGITAEAERGEDSPRPRMKTR